MQRILSIKLENESGALSRVVSMFSARGYNIDSMTVSATEDVSMFRLTVITHGDADVIQQITKQINKIVECNEVVDITDKPHVRRELMLVKVRADKPDVRAEIMRLVEIFRGRVDDVTAKTYIVEVSGTEGKLDAFLQALPQNLILETARTGVTGLTRPR